MRPSKIYPNWDLRMKTNHLATLLRTHSGLSPVVQEIATTAICGEERGVGIRFSD
jgi:hypothetical protein